MRQTFPPSDSRRLDDRSTRRVSELDLDADRDDLTDFLRSLRSSRARLRRISPTEVLVSLEDSGEFERLD